MLACIEIVGAWPLHGMNSSLDRRLLETEFEIGLFPKCAFYVVFREPRSMKAK